MDSTDFGCGILIGNQEKNKNINTMAAGLSDVAGGKIYTPEEIKVSNFYRFEGPSDPSENAILYVIDTADGKKGSLTDAYGAYANPEISEFMEKVTEIEKKEPV